MTTKVIYSQRVLSQIQGDRSGVSLVFLAGLHGNEQEGVAALSKVLEGLEERVRNSGIRIRGSVHAILGNLEALKVNERFIDEDLNRIWTMDRLDRVNRNDDFQCSEDRELKEIMNCFESIINSATGPVVFINLHSTSSRTVPHLIINDRLDNRKLSFRYPLPVILGIDSFVEGTMHSFLNEMGHRAIGFEGGQMGQVNTIENIEAFVWLSLVLNGNLHKQDVPDIVKIHQRLLVASQGYKQVYEVVMRHTVALNEQFTMVPGYSNFQRILKGQYLADSDGSTVLARDGGHIFLPRYEEKGSSGFYLLRQVSSSWLGMSALLRKVNFERLLVMLPGVERIPNVEGAYRINQRVARFFAAELFHLLGYRRMLRREGKLVVAKKQY